MILGKQKINYWYFLVFFILLFSCHADPLLVNTEKIDVEIKIHRIESVLFNASPDSIKIINEQLLHEYGALYEDYVMFMTNSGSAHDPMAAVNLSRFVNDADMRTINNEIDSVFKDITPVKVSLTNAFSHIKYYYPDAVIPEIVTYNSGFNLGVYPVDNYFGLGFDMYLGHDDPVVKSLPSELFPLYIKKMMDKQYISVDVVKSWYMQKFVDTTEITSQVFLNTIVEEGKKMYFIHAMMPEEPEYLAIKYTLDQWQWCEQNEYKIWKEIVNQNMLYNTNPSDIAKWIDDGPFTSTIPKDSPSKAGIWVGYQIVKGYMESEGTVYSNPIKALDNLIREKDYKKMLKSYNPRK